MNLRRPKPYALIVSALLAACSPQGGPRAEATAPERPPNIVFIMADDLGYGDIEPYGQQRIQTPNLSRMALEGMRFTQFYAGTSVCAPSRSILMTGLHSGHSAIRGNKEVLPIGQHPLPASEVTIAELLREAGYATGAFGKWGLGGPDSEGLPTRQGFDEFYGYLDQRRAHFYFPEFLFRGEERDSLPNRVHPDTTGKSEGSGWPIERVRYSQDAITDEALAFIDRHRDEPFFLYVPFTTPHVSLEVPDDALEPYLDENGQSVFEETPFPGSHFAPTPMPRATFAAMVTRLDRDVGRIFTRLRELGLDENTIVFFTSDNGPERTGGADPEFFDSNGPLRGLKRDLYEGGIRVPMIVRWPGRVPANQTSDHVWASWDVLPTLASLAGVDSLPMVDGLDMGAAIVGGGAAPAHEHLYWEFHERGGKQAVRVGQWKAVRLDVGANPDAPLELYDLASDPGETVNVAGDHPDVVREMAAIMAQEHTDSEAFPLLNRKKEEEGPS